MKIIQLVCRIVIFCMTLFLFFYSGDEAPAPSEPLIDVKEGGQYTGQQLTNLIRRVQEKLESNAPTEEFKVCIHHSAFLPYHKTATKHTILQNDCIQMR